MKRRLLTQRLMIRSSRILIALTIICFSEAAAQNLVRNSGFEEHGRLDCITCPMWPEKFSAILPNWKNLNGMYPFICDSREKVEKIASEQGICLCNKVAPRSGNSMMQLDYMPSCFDQDLKSQGNSSYLSTDLSSALDIGKIYEISFWLFLPLSHDSTYAKSIGINLYPNPILNPKGRLLSGSSFPIDTVIYNKWYKVKWFVRPTCGLRFLTIGVFKGKSGPPINDFGYHNRFYIDDIIVKPIEEKYCDKGILSYCKSVEQGLDTPAVALEGATVYFDLNDTILSSVSKEILDSFALRIKDYPLSTFTIAGNTDNSGNDNKLLSKWRAQNVVKYLEEKHNIKSFRFLQLYFGDSNPVASNESEAGRRKNRHVDISQSGSDLPDILYRNILLSIFNGDIKKACEWLNIWLHVAPEQKKIYILFDPRLNPLKADPRWKLIYKRVKNSYANYKTPSQSFLLDSLGKEDQKYRTLDRYIENLNAYYAPIDSFEKRFDVSFSSTTLSEQEETRDSIHFKALIALIGESNWPKSSEIGERPAKSAFLILSHSNDSIAIARYLPLIKKRCTEGEAAWIHYAMLFDRLQVMRNLPQRFGTQYKPPSSAKDGLELFPLESPENVNEWRKEIGIEPLIFSH